MCVQHAFALVAQSDLGMSIVACVQVSVGGSADECFVVVHAADLVLFGILFLKFLCVIDFLSIISYF